MRSTRHPAGAGFALFSQTAHPRGDVSWEGDTLANRFGLGFHVYRLQHSAPECTSLGGRTQHAPSVPRRPLVDVFGTRSIVSEVLSGKRELNKEQIGRLSARFRVSPEVFF